MPPDLAPRPRSFVNTTQVSNSEASHKVLRDHPEHILPPPPSYRAATENMSQRQTPPSPQEQATSPTNMLSDHSDGDMGPTDGRKGYGKRELSTSKRAAQNRAAQRAFRQRKEGYIKKLEEQVRDYQVLSENFKAVQAENYQLRDYIINLQSRLLESQHEVPPPPSNVDGLQPGKPNHPSQTPTLPRIAEMGSIGQIPDSKPDVRPPPKPEPSSFYEPSSKRLKTSEMTPAQAALQGSSILGTTSPVSR